MLQLQEIKEYLSRLSLALRTHQQIPVTLWIKKISISCLNWENQTFITAFWHKSLKRDLLVLNSTIIYQFFVSFQTSKNQSLQRIQKEILQTPYEKDKSESSFCSMERQLSVWGHEHWKTRTCEHISANQDILGRNTISSIHTRCERNEAFYRKYRCGRETGTESSLQTTLLEQL